MFLASTNLIRATRRKYHQYQPATANLFAYRRGYSCLDEHIIPVPWQHFSRGASEFVLDDVHFLRGTDYSYAGNDGLVVSFFGLTWTDRAIKSRLLRWLLRGPFVVAVVLGLTTLVRRYGLSQGDPYNQYIPVVMVSSTLVLQYLITVLSPKLEQKLFWGDEKAISRLSRVCKTAC